MVNISSNGLIGLLESDREEILYIANSSDELDKWMFAAASEYGVDLDSCSATAISKQQKIHYVQGENAGFFDTSRKHSAPEKGRTYKIVASNVRVEGIFDSEKKYSIFRENKMINSKVILTRRASDTELVRKQGIYPSRMMKFKQFNSAAEAFIQNFDRVRVDKEDYKIVAQYCVRLLKFFEDIPSLPISLAPKLSGMLGQNVKVNMGDKTYPGQLMALHFGRKADVLINGNLKEVPKEDVWI